MILNVLLERQILRAMVKSQKMKFTVLTRMSFQKKKLMMVFMQFVAILKMMLPQ